MRNTKTTHSKGAIEGTLKKTFRFKKVSYDENKYYLETYVKCKEFKLIITVENLEIMCVYIEPKNKYSENPEHILLSKGRYSYQALKNLISRYKLLK